MAKTARQFGNSMQILEALFIFLARTNFFLSFLYEVFNMGHFLKELTFEMDD